jgi:hypothetical protein
MTIDEVEVYVTSNGHGRAAIVRRDDGFFSLYRWIWQPEHFALWKSTSWMDAKVPDSVLYNEYTTPLVGIYGTVDDARREVQSLPGFAGASLRKPD